MSFLLVVLLDAYIVLLFQYVSVSFNRVFLFFRDFLIFPGSLFLVVLFLLDGFFFWWCVSFSGVGCFLMVSFFCLMLFYWLLVYLFICFSGFFWVLRFLGVLVFWRSNFFGFLNFWGFCQFVSLPFCVFCGVLLCGGLYYKLCHFLLILIFLKSLDNLRLFVCCFL